MKTNYTVVVDSEFNETNIIKSVNEAINTEMEALHVPYGIICNTSYGTIFLMENKKSADTYLKEQNLVNKRKVYDVTLNACFLKKH